MERCSLWKGVRYGKVFAMERCSLWKGVRYRFSFFKILKDGEIKLVFSSSLRAILKHYYTSKNTCENESIWNTQPFEHTLSTQPFEPTTHWTHNSWSTQHFEHKTLSTYNTLCLYILFEAIPSLKTYQKMNHVIPYLSSIGQVLITSIVLRHTFAEQLNQ